MKFMRVAPRLWSLRIGDWMICRYRHWRRPQLRRFYGRSVIEFGPLQIGRVPLRRDVVSP